VILRGHRIAGVTLLVLIVCCALVWTGCAGTAGAKDDNGSTGQTGQTGQGGQTGKSTTPAGIGLIISEVMSKNSGSLTAPDGTTPDWVELYNAGPKAVSLKGYMLSDNARKPDKYVFEAGIIESGAYLLLYASGKEATSGGKIYLPFKVSSKGEELILTAPTAKVADKWTVPALPADISYGRNGNDASSTAAKVFFGNPTPGKGNGTDGKPTAEAAMTPAVSTLLINEYCTRNSALYDDAGDTPDWVEIYNSGGDAIELTGYGLSDDLTKLDKWQFPKVSLASKAYLVLLLSGKTDASAADTKPDSQGRLHVDFRLSAKDKQLVVSDNRGRTVSTAAVEDLPLNVSKGRVPNKTDTWAYFSRPTPGAANTTASFSTLSDADSQASRDVMVSEVFAEDGVNPATPQQDWIELYNNTNKKIDLTGYGLSDQADDPFRMKLENVSIAAKGTVVVTPTAFAISSRGETIQLTDPSGWVEDAFPSGYLRAGMSSGREVGTSGPGSLDRFFFAKPTKGQPNNSTGYKAYTNVPTITVAKEAGGATVSSLYISQPVLVTIKTTQADATIYYTLDGRKPTSTSTVYHNPIAVDDSAVVKAIAIRPQCLPSDSVSRTLIKDTPHDLPVISLSGDPEVLTGSSDGLLTAEDTIEEEPLEFAFYETNGQLGVDTQAGAELHGQFSKSEAQKSLEIKFRSAYGANEVTYPFFPGDKVTTFRRLVLRTSGQDWQFTKIRDTFMTNLVQGQLDVDTMAFRYCAVYVNGKYWGLYDLREKLDQFYAAEHYGVDPDKVDLIKGNNMVVAGSAKNMNDLVQYCKTHDLTDATAYKYVLDRIDENSLMDWIIAESFFGNADSGNKKFWRPTTTGGQYKWMLFDLDWGLFPSTINNDRLYGDLLDPAGHGQGNWFSTTLQVSLLKNPDFKNKFVHRYADFLNTTFATDRMLKIFDDNVDAIQSEMPRQIARWGKPTTVKSWQSLVSALRGLVSNRRVQMIQSLQQNFGLSQATMKQLFPKDFD
jgi:hypothetical protein